MTSSAKGLKTLKLSVLCANNAKKGFDEEHGLALWLQSDKNTVLFDTGQGESIDYNAELLGIKINHSDMVVLSHGHFDHTGGLIEVLHGSTHCHLWAHPGIAVERYSLEANRPPRTVGMPPAALKRLQSLPSSRIHYTDSSQLILSWLGISGTIPKEHPLEDVGGPFFFDREGKNPDPISDENALWIRSDAGLIILTGCCHSGLINTVNHIRKASGTDKISAIIGGLHLKNASEKRLKVTAEFLESLDLDFIMAGHCTGDNALDYLRKKLPLLKIDELMAGSCMEIQIISD